MQKDKKEDMIIDRKRRLCRKRDKRKNKKKNIKRT